MNNKDFLTHKSASDRRWKIAPQTLGSFTSYLQNHFHYPDMIAPMLLSRVLGENWEEQLSPNTDNADYATMCSAMDRFLDPKFKTSTEFRTDLKNMDLACELILNALDEDLANPDRTNSVIGILSDYDVDGACSAAMLKGWLEETGANRIEFHIPDRVTEGYGPNKGAIDSLISKGCNLIILLDMGTNSQSLLEPYVKNQKCNFVVIDHHQQQFIPKEELYPLINPNQAGDPLKNTLGIVCAAGLVFLTLTALSKRAKDTKKKLPNLFDYLDLTAMATLCDVMPLKGINRLFLTQGLKTLQHSKRPGITALCDIAGVVQSTLTPENIGFALGPRINAAGRIANQRASTMILFEKDHREAASLATELDMANKRRKDLEQDATNQALKEIEETIDTKEVESILFVESTNWHQGIVGIVAGRLKEKFNRPTLVGSHDEQTGIIKGSGRSIPGINLGAIITEAKEKEILLSGGGHAMAAGFSLYHDKLEEFRKFLNSIKFDEATSFSMPDLHIESLINLRAANDEKLASDLQKLQPYGNANPEPCIAIPNVRCGRAIRVGKDKNTLIINLQDEHGRGLLKGLIFQADQKPYTSIFENPNVGLMHVAGYLRRETWQDRTTTTIFIEDAAYSA